MRRALLCLACLAGASWLPTVGAESGDGAARRIPVVTTAAARRMFEERLLVQGNIEAKNEALVPARLKATLTALYVDEGDVVKAGETPLLLTDDLNLRNALELRRLDLAVAACGVREKEANVERLEADLERKRKDYERQQRLFEDDRIGTLDSVEGAESAYRQALASLKHGQTWVDLAKEQQRQAETAVRIADKDLGDAVVLAPISGIVSERRQEVGEMGDPATAAFRIVDLSRLEARAYLPAHYYTAIEPGQTRAALRVGDIDLGERLITYRAPSIDPQHRVFAIKCLIEGPPASVVPGAMASVTVVLRREEGLGVPREAIVKRDGKDIVFRLDAGTARQAVVETGLETGGWVQVRSAELAEGVPVVTMGQFLLNDGASIEALGAAPGAAAALSPNGVPTVVKAQTPSSEAVRKEN